jgi:hypothetical protein
MHPCRVRLLPHLCFILPASPYSQSIVVPIFLALHLTPLLIISIWMTLLPIPLLLVLMVPVVVKVVVDGCRVMTL